MEETRITVSVVVVFDDDDDDDDDYDDDDDDDDNHLFMSKCSAYSYLPAFLSRLLACPSISLFYSLLNNISDN